MNETIELVKKMKELKWVGWEDPEATAKNTEGYAWSFIKSANEWLPNPGRVALLNEIKILMGEQDFETSVAKGRKLIEVKNDDSHEGWMRLWIRLKEEEIKNNHD